MLEKENVWYRSATSRNPFALPMSEIMKNFMFHGTGEDIEGNLKPGGYDGLLWTADNPAVAQTYIPSSGGKIGFNWDEYKDDDDVVEFGREFPGSFLDKVFRKIGYGYPVNYELSPRGTFQSWGYHNNKKPTYGALRNYLRSLGYDEDDGWLSVDYRSDEPVLPKNYRAPGQLFMGRAQSPLKIFDTTGDLESSLVNPAYNELGLFRRIEKSGYDGVKINDFAQTKNWGNVPHTSTGLFPHAIERVKWDNIPAVNFDWDDDIVGKFSTPEWDAFHRDQIMRAIQSGETLSPELEAWAKS